METSLQKRAIILLGALVLQALLGLFAGNNSTSLLLHAILGIGLLAGSTFFLVQAKGQASWKIYSVAGFAGILVAVVSGVLYLVVLSDFFVGSMVVGGVCAIIAYAWGAFANRK